MSADQFWRKWNHLKSIHDRRAAEYARELIGQCKQLLDRALAEDMWKETYTWI